MATLMVSASPNAMIEPGGNADTVRANASNLAINLTSGSAVPIQIEQAQRTDISNSAESYSSEKWYLKEPAQQTSNSYFQTSVSEIPKLPVYLPAPTTAEAIMTVGSELTIVESGSFLDGTDQPDEPARSDEDVIIVVGPDRNSPVDPLSAVNAEAFEIGQDFDRALMAPVAMAYKDAVPEPVRSGLRNFLNNLGEPVVFLNYLLQLKPGKAIETLGRFAVNSTIGIGGAIDVAKNEPFNLPHRKNGFGNTLGYYGVDSGAYLYLPIIGATTMRDLVGDGLDLMVLPTAVGRPFNQITYTAPAGILRALDRRIELDDDIREMQDESADPYVAARKQYLQMRQTEIDILRGRIADPLSRKNKPVTEDEANNSVSYQQETAQLWYLVR